MAESIREELAVTVNSAKSKLTYPPRVATKSKEEKRPVVDPPNSSAPRRGRSSSTVSKSVSVLDFSAKEKSAKPPRRLSVPAKSAVGSAPKSTGNITPISETKAKRLASTHGKSKTPLSDVYRASSQKKFNPLFSASHWLEQIKYSEDAAKHSLSLEFFKLALEVGCEPLQKVRNGLKSYARRHNLGEFGERVKDLFDRYSISETSEQLKVSETCSQLPEEVTRSSDEEVHSSSSTMGTRKLKPPSLNTDVAQISSVSESVKKETIPKNYPATRNRASLNKNSVNSRSIPDSANRNIHKNPQKRINRETNKEKDRNKQGKKSPGEEGSVSPSARDKVEENNKENMDSSTIQEICV